MTEIGSAKLAHAEEQIAANAWRLPNGTLVIGISTSFGRTQSLVVSR